MPTRPKARCAHLEAFMEGVAGQVPGQALPAIRKQIDRQIHAAPGRERVGARWAAFLPLTVLIDLAEVDDEVVESAFPATEDPQLTCGTTLDMVQVRRRLMAAKRARVSRWREAEVSPRSPNKRDG